MDMASEQALFRSLRELSIVVIHPEDEDGRTLRDHLKRIGCRTRLVWPSPRQLPEDTDVVFFLLTGESESGPAWLDGPTRAVPIAVLAYENPVMLEALSEANAYGIVTKPVRPFGILANLFLARSLFKYQERLHSRIAKLDETLKGRRAIERATKLLSERHNVSEDEAYGMLRREAMRKQFSVTSMAEAVVTAESFYSAQKRDIG